MRCIATARGFIGNTMREPGDVFDTDIDPEVFKGPKAPSWFKPHVEKQPKQEPASRGKQSENGKGEGKGDEELV